MILIFEIKEFVGGFILIFNFYEITLNNVYSKGLFIYI